MSFTGWLLGRVAGVVVDAGIEAARNIPEATIQNLKHAGNELLQKGKAAFMQQGRNFFNPSTAEDIASQTLDVWFKKIFYHNNEIQVDLEKKIVEAEKHGNHELVILYKSIKESLPSLKEMFNHWQTNPNLPSPDIKTINPMIAEYLSAIRLKIIDNVNSSPIQYWNAVDLKYQTYLDDKKKSLVNNLGITLYEKFKAFELSQLNPSNDKNFNSLIGDEIKKHLINGNYNNNLVTVAGDKNDPAASKLKSVIGLFPDINGIGNNGLNALQQAVIAGNIEQVTILLQQGANPNVTVMRGDWKGWSPLQIAAYENNNVLVSLLLKYRADPNEVVKTTDQYGGHTPLSLALLNPVFKHLKAGYSLNPDQQYQTVEQLCANGANVNKPVVDHHGIVALKKDDWRCWTPLAIAIQNWGKKIMSDHQIKLIETLTNHGADTNLAMQGNRDNWNGWAPMHLLAYNEHNLSSETRQQIKQNLFEHKGDAKQSIKTNDKYNGKSAEEIEKVRTGKILSVRSMPIEKPKAALEIIHKTQNQVQQPKQATNRVQPNYIPASENSTKAIPSQDSTSNNLDEKHEDSFFDSFVEIADTQNMVEEKLSPDVNSIKNQNLASRAVNGICNVGKNLFGFFKPAQKEETPADSPLQDTKNSSPQPRNK